MTSMNAIAWPEPVILNWWLPCNEAIWCKDRFEDGHLLDYRFYGMVEVDLLETAFVDDRFPIAVSTRLILSAWRQQVWKATKA